MEHFVAMFNRFHPFGIFTKRSILNFAGLLDPSVLFYVTAAKNA